MNYYSNNIQSHSCWLPIRWSHGSRLGGFWNKNTVICHLSIQSEIPWDRIVWFHYQPVNWTTLAHWGWDEIYAILQMTYSNAFSLMKMYWFWLNSWWNSFWRAQLTIFKHCFREWLGTDQATSHNLLMMIILLMHIWVTWPQWVKDKWTGGFTANSTRGYKICCSISIGIPIIKIYGCDLHCENFCTWKDGLNVDWNKPIKIAGIMLGTKAYHTAYFWCCASY